MPDEERTVAQLAAAFRQVIEEEERGRPDDEVESARGRKQEAVLAVTGAALGDPRSLARNEPDVEG